MHGTAAVADGQQLRFYMSVDRRRDAGLLAGFIKATLVVLPLLLIVVALGAGLIARTGLAPLRRFNQLAASIGTKSLNQRVSVSGLPGELEDMAVEFNSMLERIDDGYRRLQDFSGDLAHEMRTPVATLLGRTQVALSHTRTVTELREVLEGNVEELERLSTLISDMLFIARADHNAAPVQAEPVDVAGEAHRVAEYLSLIAEEKNVKLKVLGESPPLAADRLLIQRAITNLVSNAIRHAFEHSTVTIEVGAAGSTTTLAVTNQGEEIAPANLERIFDRFYRVDSGRARLKGGTGLGLAIVRSIATAHKGSVAVLSRSGETTFTLSLPQGPQTVAQPANEVTRALSAQQRDETTSPRTGEPG
jgi:two-component system heavy metal sensor histidine kinase CusS